MENQHQDNKPSTADESTIDDIRILSLMRHAETSGRPDIAQLCWAALSERECEKRRRTLGKIRRMATRWGDLSGDPPARYGIAGTGDRSVDFDTRFPANPRAARAWLPISPVPRESLADDEPTENRPLVLALVEFQCPVCHRPMIATDDRGTLRMPWHRTEGAIFPFGIGGPAHRMECPASLMAISQVCDGDHRVPHCGDPQCWQESGSPAQASEEFRMRTRGWPR